MQKLLACFAGFVGLMLMSLATPQLAVAASRDGPGDLALVATMPTATAGMLTPNQDVIVRIRSPAESTTRSLAIAILHGPSAPALAPNSHITVRIRSPAA